MSKASPSNLTVAFDGFDAKSHPDCQGAKKIIVTEGECIHSAVTVGAPFFFVGAPPGNHAVQLAVYKSLALFLSVEVSATGIRRLKEYNALDSTEKRNLSYWLGMTFAGIAASRCLDVQYLVHAESMLKAKRLIKKRGAGKRLADLIGQDTAKRWHVLEAKSRQIEPSGTTIAKWRKQASQTVDTIGKKQPHTMSCSSLVLASKAYVTLIDPPTNERAPSIEFHEPQDQLASWYYAPWLAAIDHGCEEVQLGEQTGFIAMSLIDRRRTRRVDVGLTSSAWRQAKDGNYMMGRQPQYLGDSFVGRDGIFVRLSSESANSRSPA
jgi:hypothetical protein